MNPALIRKIARKTLRIFIIVYLIALPICVVVGYFLRENKMLHDGHAMPFALFALACAGVVLYFMTLVVVLGFAVFLFWWSLFDLMKNEFAHTHNKILWFVMIILFPVVGMIFYIIISPKQKIQVENVPKQEF